MKTLAFIALPFLVLALAACQPHPTAGASPAASTPAPTLMVQSLPSAAPSSTPSPASHQASATLEIPAATPDYVKTLVSARTPIVLSSFPSPDGRWRAEAIQYTCLPVSPDEGMVYEQLKLISQDGREKVIEDQVHLCEGLGAFGLDGLFWSPNSRYFYYSSASQGVPDGLVCYWDRPMSRVDAKPVRSII
jgi:hypothetical protein